jgi:hypothetical protein
MGESVLVRGRFRVQCDVVFDFAFGSGCLEWFGFDVVFRSWHSAVLRNEPLIRSLCVITKTSSFAAADRTEGLFSPALSADHEGLSKVQRFHVEPLFGIEFVRFGQIGPGRRRSRGPPVTAVAGPRTRRLAFLLMQCG